VYDAFTPLRCGKEFSDREKFWWGSVSVSVSVTVEKVSVAHIISLTKTTVRLVCKSPSMVFGYQEQTVSLLGFDDCFLAIFSLLPCTQKPSLFFFSIRLVFQSKIMAIIAIFCFERRRLADIFNSSQTCFLLIYE
jgi:hypothetical protein